MPDPTPDAPVWPDERIADLAGWTLVRTFLRFVPLFADALAPLGLSPTQFGVLVAVDNAPGIAQGSLARRCQMTPQSMGELLPGLEQAGWLVRGVARGRGHPIPVRITPAGRALLLEATPRVERVNAAPALGLDEGERRTLNALLTKMGDALDAEPRDRPRP